MKTKFTLLVISAFLNTSLILQGEEQGPADISSISPKEFDSLLIEVKSIHSLGPKVYFTENIQDNWKLIKPVMIIVEHDNVKFFLNSNLLSSEILEFSRITGAWSPKNTRWTAKYKSPNDQKSNDVWSRTDLISDEELEIIHKYNDYRNALQKSAESKVTEPNPPDQ